nr:response regulator [Butyrivibrio sp.]
MRTVMVVEDEKLIRQGIATMIKRTGVPVDEVIECPNGVKAMEVLREKKVDVVFTDIRMPKMNGIELVQAMKELDSPPIAIAVSGYDDFSYAVEMMRNGVREYILKPVERDKLKEVMEKLEAELSA